MSTFRFVFWRLGFASDAWAFVPGWRRLFWRVWLRTTIWRPPEGFQEIHDQLQTELLQAFRVPSDLFDAEQPDPRSARKS